MNVFGLLLLLAFSLTSFAQPKVTEVDKKAIPKSATYIGTIKQAARWTDKTGDHLVILTQTGETQSKTADDEFYRDAALFAYHYLLKGDSSKLTWKLYDFIKECPVDISLYFVGKSFAVTDLNKDGMAEVWLMYKSACHGDVSPIPMKIIMYENDKKYAARGEIRVRVSESEYMGGNFSFDDAFKRAPAVFRKYAEKLWERHKEETWEE